MERRSARGRRKTSRSASTPILPSVRG